MKDIYGLSNGSEENLVNINYLLEKFNEYEILENENHNILISNLDTKNIIKSEYQKQILKYHTTIVLKKK